MLPCLSLQSSCEIILYTKSPPPSPSAYSDPSSLPRLPFAQNQLQTQTAAKLAIEQSAAMASTRVTQLEQEITNLKLEATKRKHSGKLLADTWDAQKL